MKSFLIPQINISIRIMGYLAATDLNRQVEDAFTVLKFTFITQRNRFSVIDFFTLNLLLHAYSLVRQLEA